MYSLKNAIRKYLRIQPLVVGKDVDTGMVNRYNNPREVGVDRLVNGVSAVARYGKPLIIVDIGTAITFDAIDPDGAYLGGRNFPRHQGRHGGALYEGVQAAARGYRAD